MSAGAPRLAVPVDARDHAQGPNDAPVTLVEYGDYECSYCGMAAPIVRDVRARMGARLRFVFRNFPLATMHPHAEHAAEAADGQGAFWAMHGLLYANQEALDDDSLVAYAAELGLDEARVAREIAADAHAARIRADFLSGARSGVNGTPTFFINGVRHDGSWERDALLQALEAAS